MYEWNGSNWGTRAQVPNEWLARGEIDEDERAARRAELPPTQ